MEKLFNLPIRSEAQAYYNEEFAKKNAENIIEQTERGKIRGMKPFELTLVNGKATVVFLLPEFPHVG